MSAFLLSIALMEGRDVHGALASWRARFYKTWTTGVCFWAPVQALNFFLVPSALRVPFVNVAACAWNALLSYIHHRNRHH